MSASTPSSNNQFELISKTTEHSLIRLEIAAACLIVVPMLLAFGVLEKNLMSYFANWLSDWQTLVTGMLALLVGAGTVTLLRRQLAQQEEQHRIARQSRFSVAKAKTPFAAVEIAEHARSYLNAAIELWPLVKSRSREGFQFDGPAFPEKSEQILDGLVEHADDPLLIEQVSAIYSEHQVMSSRLSDVARPSEHAITITDYVLQPAMMDAIAMNLLAFGRDGVDIQKLSWRDVRVSAKRLIKDLTIRQHILDHIDDRVKRGKPVPLALRRHSNDR